jgi:hypothetical protein
MPNKLNKNSNAMKTVSGHVEIATFVTLASGKYGIQVNETLSNVLTTLSTIYRFYKLTKVKFSVLPSSAYSGPILAQFIPGGGSTTSGAANGVMESEIVLAHGINATVPTSMHLTHKHLHGLTEWYVTEGDPNEIYLESQGVINLEGGASDLVYLKYEIDYQFKESMATELAMSQLRLRSENARLKEALSSMAGMSTNK